MASSNDGRIVLGVQVDKTGLKEGFSSIKSSVKNISSELKMLGSVLTTYFSIKALIDFSKASSEMAVETEASVQRIIDIYGEASKAVGKFIDSTSRKLGMSKAQASKVASVYGNLFSVWAEQNTNANLTNEYLRTTAVVASKTGRTIEDVQERIRSGLLGNTEAVEDLGIFVNIKTIEITDAFKRIADGRSWDKLNAYEQSQVRALAILEQATSKYGTEVAKTSAFTKQQYKAAFEDFKNTWGKVVNVVLMPILSVATKLLNTLTQGLMLLTKMSGQTIDTNKQFDKQENSIKNSAENQEELNDALKKTKKEQKNVLAGFDEIDVLTKKTQEDASSQINQDAYVPDLSLSEEGSIVNEGEYTSKLAAIGMVSGWALVGLGVLLMFSGQPIIGISAAAAGLALVVGSVEGGKTLGQEEKDKLIKLGNIAGLALVGLGLLLLFTSFSALGLGLIAAGASALMTSVVLGTSDPGTDIKSKLEAIAELTGKALITIGLFLIFFGQIPLGIGFLIAGASALIAETMEKETNVDTTIKDKLSQLANLAGKALIGIGLILLFFGQAPLGIGFIVAGAISLITANAVEETDAAKTALDKLQAVEKAVAEALVAIGVLLLFLGQVPWGIGFIVAGAVLFAVSETKAGTTNADVDVKERIAKITDVVGKSFVAVGLLLIFLGQIPWGIGFIVAGAGLSNISEIIPATSASEILDACDGILSFLNAVVTYFVAKQLIANLATFVKLWGDFKTLMVLIKTEGFVKTIRDLFGGKSLESANLYAIAIATLVWGISYLIANWENLTPMQRVITIFSSLAAAATAAAVAVALFYTSWSVGVAAAAIAGGVALLAGTALFKNYNGSKDLSSSSGAIPSNIEEYAYLAAGGTYSLPALAQGAVLPPNKPFMAIVGDQKNGTNIEAPLSTIEQAVSNVLNREGGFGGGSSTVVLQIDGHEFGRAVIEQGNRENRRIGTRLVTT